jgi:DNA polymerase III alpha subunit
LFERFLNPERISMPDIDLDFDERRRSEMIAYATQKYGEDRVADLQNAWAKEKLKLDAIYDAVKNFNNQFKNANIPALQL